MPREHGAYFALLLPIAAALWSIGPSPLGIAIASASCFVFLLSEPLRALRHPTRPEAIEHRRYAFVQAAGHAAAAAALGGYCLASADTVTRYALMSGALAAAAGLLLTNLSCRRRGLVGNVIGVAILVSPGAAILVSGGATVSEVARFWLAWGLGLGAATTACFAIVFRSGPRSPALEAAVLTLAAAGVAALAVADASVLGMTPLIACSWWTWASPPAPSELRTTGWRLAACASVACVV